MATESMEFIVDYDIQCCRVDIGILHWREKDGNTTKQAAFAADNGQILFKDVPEGEKIPYLGSISYEVLGGNKLKLHIVGPVDIFDHTPNADLRDRLDDVNTKLDVVLNRL